MIRQLQFYLAMIDSEEDRRKFEILYYRLERLLYRKAMSILSKPNLAEDALQDAFTYIAEHMEKIDDPESEDTKAYMITVVKHKAHDILRKERVREDRHADYEELENIADVDFTEFVGNNDLAIAMKMIDETYLTALLLRSVYHYSAKEIASFMGCTVSKAEKLVSRGRRMLETAYEEVQNR